jgi:hypothetical protein
LVARLKPCQFIIDVNELFLHPLALNPPPKQKQSIEQYLLRTGEMFLPIFPSLFHFSSVHPIS